MTQIWLSLGSNIQREYHIRGATQTLRQRFGNITISPVYESEAVGFDGEAFYNLVVGVTSSLSLNELNQMFRQIEDQHGRIRGNDKFTARTLDIDILTFGHWICPDDQWDIPRDEIVRYAFVLLPLSDVAGNENHPELQQTYAQLWQDFDSSSQQLTQIELVNL